MSPKTILLVDADSASLNYLTQMLQEQHYEILRTGSGKEGLIYAWRDRPHLIIIDPVMKDISGQQFLEKMRQDTRTSKTPILALSSDPNPAFKHICLEAGCTEYLLKSTSIDPKKLSTMGFGEYRPLATNDTAEGRRKNRRVEIIVSM